MKAWPRHKTLAALVPLLLLHCPLAGAQVTRCLDAAGKVTYSDSACANTSATSSQLLSREQVDRARANDQATQAARAEDQAGNRPAVRAPNQEPAPLQSPAGPVLLDHDPNQRIREQEERNTAKRSAELEAQARARRDDEERVRNAPLTVYGCDRFGCQTNKGYAPRTD
jgi:hypothetical protein